MGLTLAAATDSPVSSAPARSLIRMRLTTAAPAALLVVLAGCTTDDTGSSGADDPPSPPAPLQSSSGAAADGTTAPGSVLRYGETARVAMQRSGEAPDGLLDVTVVDVEELGEVEGAEVDDDESVYVVSGTFVVVEPPTGRQQPTVNVTGSLGERITNGVGWEENKTVGCLPVDLDDDVEAGTSVGFCVVAIAPPDQPVGGSWSFFEDAGGERVVWQE